MSNDSRSIFYKKYDEIKKDALRISKNVTNPKKFDHDIMKLLERADCILSNTSEDIELKKKRKELILFIEKIERDITKSFSSGKKLTYYEEGVTESYKWETNQ